MSRKYIIVNEGTDFRRIAKIMTSGGIPMNHATARNQLMIAMENLFMQIGNQIGIKLDKKQIGNLINSQTIHSILPDILFQAVNLKKKEKK